MVKSVFKEKHTPIRIVQNVPVILVLITMLMQILCGIILSKHPLGHGDKKLLKESLPVYQKSMEKAMLRLSSAGIYSQVMLSFRALRMQNILNQTLICLILN